MALAVFGGVMSAFAIDVEGESPTYVGEGIYDLTTITINGLVSKSFYDALGEVQDMVGGINAKPKKFIRAWGNSAVYASHGATQRAFGEYDLFSVSAGPMVGMQIPVNPFAIGNELSGLEKKLNEERDLSLGFNPQMTNTQLGLNMSEFLLNNLYLGLRVCYMKLDNMIEGFSFSNLTLGLLVNYQILPQMKFLGGLVHWRGVNLGSGFIYQGTTIGYNLKMDTISQYIGTVGIPNYGNRDLNLLINPELTLDMKINTYTIPLEATTSVKLLYFLNLAIGLGADLGFGKSDIKIGMSSNIDINGLEGINEIRQDNSGYVSVNAGGDMAPSVFNVKLMAGIGFSMGRVVFDIPITWYFMYNGFNIGITLGTVW
jgi:hypothetical protein